MGLASGLTFFYSPELRSFYARLGQARPGSSLMKENWLEPVSKRHFSGKNYIVIVNLFNKIVHFV